MSFSISSPAVSTQNLSTSIKEEVNLAKGNNLNSNEKKVQTTLKENSFSPSHYSSKKTHMEPLYDVTKFADPYDVGIYFSKSKGMTREQLIDLYRNV